jgi:hypothetical protein
MRGLGKPDGAFRNALAQCREEPFRARRFLRPMDRPRSWPRPPRGTVLDMDSSVSPAHGEQEMSVWNGYYDGTVHIPLSAT